MSSKLRINEIIYNVLIKNKLNNFTVTEMKLTILGMTNAFTSDIEARKFAYRQILALERKGLLKKVKHRNRTKATYKQTELLLNYNVISKPYKPSISVKDNRGLESELLVSVTKKKSHYEAELAIVLSETEEVKSVMSSFPDESEVLQPLYLDLRQQSATLYGKVNALTKIIEMKIAC